MADIRFNDENLPPDLRELLLKIGRIEWSITNPLTAEGHAENTRSSVNLTAEAFEQQGPQAMQFLTIEGTETVIAYVGTSPNSGNIARLLAGIWNALQSAVAADEEAAHG